MIKIGVLEDDGVDSGCWERGNTEECLYVNGVDPNVMCIEFECPALSWCHGCEEHWYRPLSVHAFSLPTSSHSHLSRRRFMDRA